MRKPLSLLSLTVALLLISWFSIEPDVKSSSASTGQTRGFTNVSGAQQDDPVKIVVSDPVVPTISLPISQLPLYEPEYYLDREINPRLSDLDNFDPNLRGVGGLDPLLAVQASVTPQGGDFLTPILNFAGQGFTGVNPPDTEGDVGPNHYIQMINAGGGAVLTIYDKNGVLLAGPTSLDSLGTGSCASGLGDPIVLYDQLADRWLLSEFAASGNHLCVYISATNDPVTTNWFAYDFTTPNFPDYPKYAVWPDAYYVSSNESSPAAYALDRTNMLAGQPATSQRFTAPDLSGFPFQALTPSDHDGATPPPAGSPNYFMRHRDTEVHGAGTCTNPATTDCLEIWAFHVDFDTPANSTFALAQTIEVTNFDSDLCGLVSFSCFPMPGTGTTLDPLREVIMWRLQYRNFGAYETLVGNLVTDVDGTNHGGVRWFELRKSGASPWALYQEGTLAPDIHHRWMGSSAMDGSGNIALGYSVSSSTVFPSIRYAGRLASDPLGTLPYVEGTIVNGSASNASNRWGDYSAMSVDPADDCTFWYTHMYNVSSTWSTRIATMRFPQCGGPGFSISATPESQSICMPADAIYNVNLSFTDGYDAPVDLSANGVPAGATAVFDPSTVISPTTSSVFTISNTGSASPGSYSIDIIGMGTPTPTHTTTVQLNLFDGVPGAPVLLTPADMATNIPVTPDFSWNAVSSATAYTLELADDINFTNIIYTANVAGTSHTLPGANALAYNTWHYWRVTASNPCGSGATSAEFRFRTVEQPATFCATPGLSIPDNNPTGVSHTMNIPTSANILDVDIYVKATHTWVGDLRFVISHNATNATIIDRPGVPASTFGCSGDNYDVTVNDEGPDGNIETQCATNPAISGDRVGGDPPNSSLLAAYDGMDISGDWTITVSDHAGSDIGTLVEWCVVPTLEASGGGVDLSPDQDGSGAPGSVVVYTLSITNTGSVSDTFDLTVDAQWATMLSASSISLDAGAVGTFTAEVSVPGNAAAGDVGLSLVTATSQSDGSVSDDAFLTTTATELRDVVLSADPDALSGEPGAVVTYTVHITNTGNTTDTFTLSTADDNGWMSHLSETSITLGAGESEMVMVMVHVDAGAADEDMNVTTVTAVSDNDPSATASVDLTTTASVPVEPGYTIYLPIILKP